MKNLIIFLTLFLITILINGCAKNSVTSQKLIDAQTKYLKLSKDSNVKKSASLELIEAEKIYQISKNVKDQSQADHVAYLLEKELEIIDQTIKQKELEDRLSKLKELKTKALIDAKVVELKAMQHEIDEVKNQLIIAKKEAEATKKLMQERLKKLKELHAKETNRGLVLTLSDVLFESGKSTLLPGSMRTIDKLADFLKAYPNRNVLIEGHTDNVGSEEYNIELSLKRANSVADALIERGIDKNRILTQGLGEAYPVATNKTKEGRQKNRRVEIIVLEENVSHESMKR